LTGWPDGAQLAKDLKPGRRSSIIKIDEQIVGDERKSACTVEIILDIACGTGSSNPFPFTGD
jgi:hypothetical protein